MQRKLPRTRSAEEICAQKVSDCDDLKGYASDSTVSHQVASKDKHAPILRKKRKCKERGGEGGEQHHTKDHKSWPSPVGSLFPPLNLGMMRMKSTGSILNTPDCTPSSMLCESRECLLSFDTRHRRKISTGSHRRRSRPEPSYAMLGGRRRSVDNVLGRACGACGRAGGLSPCKPLRRGGKAKDDPRHVGKERTLRCRHLSRSFKGEKDRNRKQSHQEEQDCVRKSGLNRSLSFSSAGDYEGARENFEPLRHHASTSGSKWIVYGYF